MSWLIYLFIHKRHIRPLFGLHHIFWGVFSFVLFCFVLVWFGIAAFNSIPAGKVNGINCNRISWAIAVLHLFIRLVLLFFRFIDVATLPTWSSSLIATVNLDGSLACWSLDSLVCLGAVKFVFECDVAINQSNRHHPP